jgi:hypothetical protein
LRPISSSALPVLVLAMPSSVCARRRALSADAAQVLRRNVQSGCRGQNRFCGFSVERQWLCRCFGVLISPTCSVPPLSPLSSLLFGVALCHSASRAGRVKDADAVYRTDVFPGLGWMITLEIWREIGSKWPQSYWDEWMRLPEVLLFLTFLLLHFLHRPHYLYPPSLPHRPLHSSSPAVRCTKAAAFCGRRSAAPAPLGSRSCRAKACIVTFFHLATTGQQRRAVLLGVSVAHRA